MQCVDACVCHILMRMVQLLLSQVPLKTQFIKQFQRRCYHQGAETEKLDHTTYVTHPSEADGRDWIFRAVLGCFGLFFVSVVVFWASINFMLMWRKSLSSLPFLAMNLFYALPRQVRHLILFTIFFKHMHGQGDPFHYCQSLVYFINSALWVSNGDTIVFLAGIQIKPM